MAKQIEYYTESYYDDGSDAYLVARLSLTVGGTLVTFQCHPKDKSEGQSIILHNVRHAIAILQNWVDDQENDK